MATDIFRCTKKALFWHAMLQFWGGFMFGAFGCRFLGLYVRTAALQPGTRGRGEASHAYHEPPEIQRSRRRGERKAHDTRQLNDGSVRRERFSA